MPGRWRDAHRGLLHGQAHERGERLHHHAGAADRGDAQCRVRARPDRVVDLGHDHGHRERLGGQLGRQDVAVVALGQREEPVRAFDADAPEDVLVGAIGADRVPAEALGELVERVGLEVDDGDLVTRLVEPTRQASADPATADDDGAHLLSRSDLPGSCASRGELVPPEPPEPPDPPDPPPRSSSPRRESASDEESVCRRMTEPRITARLHEQAVGLRVAPRLVDGSRTTRTLQGAFWKT